jgi:dTDP-4-amino-4,6-dideoxygalactose transaminase
VVDAVSFVGLKQNYDKYGDEVLAAVKRCLELGDFIMRDDVDEFEASVAQLHGRKHAIGLNSGTDALFLSLKAAGIGPGDEVITVGHTFVASISAIVHCGATPILVDVGPDHVMDVDQAIGKINSKTKAIIPVHLNGRLVDMKRLMAAADKANIVVVEDAAQAWLATREGQMAGTLGLTGCFSLYPMKTLGSIGDGGIVVTDDDAIASKIRSLRDHGQVRKSDRIDLDFYGYNSRLDNIAAAVLNTRLPHLREWVEWRGTLAGVYNKHLSKIPHITIPLYETHTDELFDSYQNYVIQTPNRDELRAHLGEWGVETLISWPVPNHLQPGLALSHFELPATEAISNSVISLPMYAELTADEVEYVCLAVKSFYSL